MWKARPPWSLGISLLGHVEQGGPPARDTEGSGAARVLASCHRETRCGWCLSTCHCKRDVEWDSEGPALSSYVWLVASLGTFAALREREREREAIEVALQKQPRATVEIESGPKCMVCPTQHHTQHHPFRELRRPGAAPSSGQGESESLLLEQGPRPNRKGVGEKWGHQGPVQPGAFGVGPSPNESTPWSSRNSHVGGVHAELTRPPKPCWTLSTVDRAFYLYP